MSTQVIQIVEQVAELLATSSITTLDTPQQHFVIAALAAVEDGQTVTGFVGEKTTTFKALILQVFGVLGGLAVLRVAWETRFRFIVMLATFLGFAFFAVLLADPEVVQDLIKNEMFSTVRLVVG